MDCETCNDLLMDLLYDELDEVRAASVRKHIEGCGACTVAWQRVSRGRALASTLAPVTAPLPSATLLAAIEAAAKESKAARVSQPPTSVPPAEPRTETRAVGGGEDSGGVAPVVPIDHAPRRLPTWVHRLGDLAMRRQVAMAAVVLLSVGVAWKFVPSHTPSTVGTAVEGTAPEVIPATELPSETATAARPTAAAAPARSRASNTFRGGSTPSAEHRAARVAQTAPPPSPTPSAPGRSAERDEGLVGESVASNAVAMQRTGPVVANAPSARGSAASGSAAYRAQPPASDYLGTNAPSGPPSTLDRDLGRALPPSPAAAAAPTPAAPAWRASFNAGEDHRARGDTESAIAAYRAALEADPPESERARIANALIAQLARAGRVTEAETTRARYLRPAATREPALQVDESQAQSGSSVPHPSTQRPARRAAPAATNVQAY